MKFKSEFCSINLAQKLSEKIEKISRGMAFTFMEVCGTHTMAIARYGLKGVLPRSIQLLSGPGCPVCVTPVEFIDKAIALSQTPDVIIVSFGDMFRVPGSESSLSKEKAKGRNIKIIYSVDDAVEIAKSNPDKKIIFLGIGFETTAPTAAVALVGAKALELRNFFILSGFKTIPNALKVLANDERLKLDGLICPGHLSMITGLSIYEFLAKDYHLSCVVTGFEPLDILQSIYMLVKQRVEGRAEVENQYTRSVTQYGNPIALGLLDNVFNVTDSVWRGIGLIPDSGLKLKKEFGEFDAEVKFPMKLEKAKVPEGCICGEILRGVKIPIDCPLFRKVCTPQNPVGACMVSSEGTCAVYYKYEKS